MYPATRKDTLQYSILMSPSLLSRCQTGQQSLCYRPDHSSQCKGSPWSMNLLCCCRWEEMIRVRWGDVAIREEPKDEKLRRENKVQTSRRQGCVEKTNCPDWKFNDNETRKGVGEMWQLLQKYTYRETQAHTHKIARQWRMVSCSPPKQCSHYKVVWACSFGMGTSANTNVTCSSASF